MDFEGFPGCLHLLRCGGGSLHPDLPVSHGAAAAGARHLPAGLSGPSARSHRTAGVNIEFSVFKFTHLLVW